MLGFQIWERKYGIMVNLGLPIETVVSATRLDPEEVRALYQPPSIDNR